jgi:dTDP-4-dehydrorhamnose 3,5-epimerase
VRFTPTPITGAWLIEPEPLADDRGFFARLFCHDEFARHGLVGSFVQSSISCNHKAGTLRGMHFQQAPYQETKLVRCTAGRIHDVILDLRPESPEYRCWWSVELSAENRLTLYIPAGVAHGFQTLTDGAEVLYQMSESYHPEAATGVRWNDPAFRMVWPLPAPILSAKDRAWPDYAGDRHA